MSKGMKQKLGIICAFMHDPDTLILDEPTSGLDPLMQDRFVNLIKKEKAKGKTILMSSHMFNEIEKTCDRVAIIRAGQIVSIFDLKEIFDGENETFEITFKDENAAHKYAENKDNVMVNDSVVRITIIRHEVNHFLKEINKYEVIKFIEIKKTLEEVFMSYYSFKNKGDGNHVV